MKFINALWEPCGGILRSDSVERRLAERQILVKDEKSKSWFVYVNKVLRQYGLPSTMDLLLNLNLNSLLVKRQIDNSSPGAVTGGN